MRCWWMFKAATDEADAMRRFEAVKAAHYASESDAQAAEALFRDLEQAILDSHEQQKAHKGFGGLVFKPDPRWQCRAKLSLMQQKWGVAVERFENAEKFHKEAACGPIN